MSMKIKSGIRSFKLYSFHFVFYKNNGIFSQRKRNFKTRCFLNKILHYTHKIKDDE
jgi:hypothetical protein